MINWYSRQILLSYSEHAHLGWRAGQASVLEHEYTWLPISLSELAKASAYLPIVIMRYQQRWLMVVLLGGSSLSNKKITNVKSLAHVFLPHCIKVYPFSLMPTDDTNSSFQLGIDQKCLVALDGQDALPLFSRNRQFSPAVAERFHLLHRLKIDSEIVDSACELLSRKGLLVLISDAEKVIVKIKERSAPLYRVDIDALARLSRDDFADLQMHHALELGVNQHSSLFHTDKLRSFAN